MAGLQQGTPAFRRVTLALFLGALATYANLYSTQPILPLLSDAFGISPATASLSLSVATASLSMALVLAGPLADSVGRKPVMTFSLFATGAIGLLAALAPRFSSFLALRVLQGIVIAGLPATGMAYLSEEVDRRYLGVAMGLYIAGNSVGGMMGRLVVGTVADYWNWRTAVGAIGLLGLLSGLWFIRALPPSRQFRAQPLKLGRLLRSLLQALRDPLLRIMYAVAFLSMGSFVTLYNYISYHLMAPPYELSATLVGWIFLLYVFGTFSSAWMGGLADRHGRRRILLLGLFTQAVGAAITLAAPLWIKVIGIAVFTAGFFGAHSTASGWVGERATTNRGAASSLYLFAYYLGSSLTGAIGGLFWMHFGWTGVVLYMGAFIGTAFVLVLTQTRTVATKADSGVAD